MAEVENVTLEKPVVETNQIVSVNPTQPDPIDDDLSVTDLYLTGIVLAVAIIVTTIFYFIKKLLIKFNLYTPKVASVIDGVQQKVSKAATKAGTKFINKKTGTTKKAEDSKVAQAAGEFVNEILEDKLKIDPVEKKEDKVEEKKEDKKD